MKKSQLLLRERNLHDLVISEKGEALVYVSDLLDELLHEGNPCARRSVESSVLCIIGEQLSIDANNFSLASYWHQDLDADSLDDVELIMSLEEEFNIKINDEEVEQYADLQVSAIIELVKSKLNE